MPSPARPDSPSLRALVPEETWPDGPTVPSERLRDCTVLVSGAGGSLGTRLVRRLLRTPVRTVLAVDTSEHALVQLQETCACQEDAEAASVIPVLADLRHAADRRRCLQAGTDEAPDVVIHAAAYKHVPFLEDRPIAAAQNNLLATVDWARACGAAGVEQFAFVSTDKAVAPTGIMGQTKRWAEQWLRHATGEEAPPTTIARLCNLFGSRGSVVPRARRRLNAGKPVPLTHPDMRRWMMTPTDAVRITLRAATGRSGTVVPSACVEVSIPDLIRRLIRHVRPDANPADWIEWTGPRPGERLREPRWGRDEETVGRGADGVRRLSCPASPSWIETDLDPLRQACTDGQEPAVRRLLGQVAEAVAPADDPVADPHPVST